ncbi:MULTISPECIES: TlpA disulfide reductase family protein [unclassified Thioalkalivibrio]|uniref:TlpA family protein disulfide reductase n=1 Tax=unclassified Thioalkalivibrio TaxID=2621013 RepID=UPI0004781CF0|nr:MULTISPECIES: TlpA disulfide reductase family protein [unclassified Thioalkalivibrio]
MKHPTQALAGVALATTGAFLLAACGDPEPEMDAGGGSADAAPEVVAEAASGNRRIDFALPDLAGDERQLSEWDGNLIVLNFWATWCPPCKKEMPLFQDTYEANRDDGFTIVAVAVDEQTATQHFVDDFGIEFPVLIGQDEAMAVGREYGNRIGALPYTVLIDRDGTIVDTHRGEVEPEDLDAWLKAHL